MKEPHFTIIGAAILDVLARPVDNSVFTAGSVSADSVLLHTGGDAMNEARVLASLGAPVRLVSKLGTDMAGDLVLSVCRDLKIDTSLVRRTKDVPTGTNIVLVDPAGERSFITNPESTLRKFGPEDIPDQAFSEGGILCFASIFVAPPLGNRELVSLFSRARNKGMTVCADMTKCKHGETVQDMKECLSYLDYVFPNYEEAALLTQEQTPDRIADALLSCGIGHVILKAGSKGCYVCTGKERFWSPACTGIPCLDTTGAGDTFTGCFLFALGHGYSLADCARFANAGASICIEQTGAAGAGTDLEKIRKRAGF